MTENNLPQNTPQSIVTKKRGLGRGLDALFDDSEMRLNVAQTYNLAQDRQMVQREDRALDMAATAPPEKSVKLPITALRPGRFQPRTHFNDDTIHQLAQSISEHGIIQPLLVRPMAGEQGVYEIIAGERRWRAAQRAQLHEVPVLIRHDLQDHQIAQLALIENLQREDLNIFDEASGYQRLVHDFGYTPERLGFALGRSRSHIVNTIRLLQLPGEVQQMVVTGALSAGHVRALIGQDGAVYLARQMIDKKMSVRQAEKMVAKLTAEKKVSADRAAGSTGILPGADEIHIAALEAQLVEATGLKVTVAMSGEGRGEMRLQFSNLDQLDLLIKRLTQAGHI